MILTLVLRQCYRDREEGHEVDKSQWLVGQSEETSSFYKKWHSHRLCLQSFS